MSDRQDGPPDDAVRICMVCGRVLDYSTTRGWVHTLADEPADHVPVVALQSEAPQQAIPRCDFCQADEVVWSLPARDFRYPGLPDGSVGAWVACDPCGQLIKRNAWSDLSQRCADSYASRRGGITPELALGMRRVHRELRKNITGPIERLRQ